MKKSLLKLDNIHFSYGDNLVLKEINLELFQGQALGIVGPNGGGKSTLLKLIIGNLTQTKGTIYYGNSPFMGYVPQHLSLNSTMPISVEELISMNQIKKSPKNMDLKELLKLTGLSEKKDQLVRRLSGGERQRALIARALINAPELLVLDEPTTGLDSTGQDQLYSLLSKIKNELDTGIVVVDHNLSQVLKHCDKILCLNKTSHWHNEKELLTNDILNSIYHCEFEHILIHEGGHAHESHDECKDPNHHHEKSPASHPFLRPKN
ncbi:MAG: metal ABC transporter ATP-binding protein [Bacteriovoracaceae bacterium]